MIYLILDNNRECIAVSKDKSLVNSAIASIYDWNVSLVQAYDNGELIFSVPIRSYIISEFLID